ncbi:hypothetical protein [Salinimicrobium soli]|uniref:hypothetical protein n=1 Tax=Salinimicrobium soli TaxID=1254399 RepID=UPI003AAC0963
MRNFKLNFKKVFIVLLSFGLMNLITSCEKEGLTEDDFNTLDARVEKEKAPKSNEGFKAFHEGFEGKIRAWVDNSVSGPMGWCGTIEQKRGSDGLQASSGNSYALLMHGGCNDYYSSGFPDGSGPATFDPSLWSTTWPQHGFMQQLDIYLDPQEFEEGLAFTYLNSLHYPALAYPFIYVGFDVEMSEGTLYVGEEEVNTAGWYTFKYTFTSNEEGYAVAVFELLDQMGVVLESSSQTLDVMASELGSGYVWFESIQEGVKLPIDEHYLSPANSSNAH